MVQIEPRLKAAFQSVGMPFSMGGKTGNTMDSHRLIAYAEAAGGVKAQNVLVDELFLNYFGQEKYIGDQDVLLEAAVTAGLDSKSAAEVIADKSMYRDEVLQQYNTYAQGIHGVPHFFIGDAQVSGAQPPEVFVDMLQKAA